ncbi:MAG: molybdopterin-dependent oxidoreductase, partial [Gammaproteobacteria bacterium]|nr:molybdopterin-dependent oxidoreductase [Gammaproteobacteria bacterium]
ANPADMVANLAAIAKATLALSGGSTPDGLDNLLGGVSINDTHNAIAQNLRDAEQATVLIGTQAMAQQELSAIRALANVIAENSNASLGYLSEGSNSAGAWLAGAVSHRGPAGQAKSDQIHAEVGYDLKGYVLLNVEPERDCANTAAALNAVTNADFVVSLATHITDAMKTYADVLLPVAAFAETEGTYVNACGEWQSFDASNTAPGEARPAWKVLRVLGNLFDADGFDYMNSNEVRDELAALTADIKASSTSIWRTPATVVRQPNMLQRIGHLPIYAVDMLVRRAEPLQNTADAIADAIYLNAETASKVGVTDEEDAVATQGECTVILPVMIDEAIPTNCVMIPTGLAETSKLGAAYGDIEIKGLNFV